MPKGQIKHFFDIQKVEMSDNSELYELVTELGERVATASTEDKLIPLEMELNCALTDAEEADSDIVINCV